MLVEGVPERLGPKEHTVAILTAAGEWEHPAGEDHQQYL